MPRPRDHSKHIATAAEDLIRAVTGLLNTVQGAVAQSAAVRDSARGVARAAGDVSAAAKAKSAKLRKSLKAYWALMKGKARKERIAKMLQGRGLRRTRAG